MKNIIIGCLLLVSIVLTYEKFTPFLKTFQSDTGKRIQAYRRKNKKKIVSFYRIENRVSGKTFFFKNKNKVFNLMLKAEKNEVRGDFKISKIYVR